MSRFIEQRLTNQDIVKDLSPKDYLRVQEENSHGKLTQTDLKKYLEVMLPEGTQPSRERVRTLIDAVGQPQRLEAIVDSLLSSPEQIASLKAFGHSTGMERIELASHGDFSLRVHFWMPGKGDQITEDPHNHTYNFGSKVLSGVLVTDFFAPGKEGDPMSEFQIASQTTKEKPKPKLVDETRLQIITPPEGIIMVDSDPTYTMGDTAIHRIRQGDPKIPIITLNLRAGGVKDVSTFYRDERMPIADPQSIQVDVGDRLALLRHTLLSKR